MNYPFGIKGADSVLEAYQKGMVTVVIKHDTCECIHVDTVYSEYSAYGSLIDRRGCIGPQGFEYYQYAISNKTIKRLRRNSAAIRLEYFMLSNIIHSELPRELRYLIAAKIDSKMIEFRDCNI